MVLRLLFAVFFLGACRQVIAEAPCGITSMAETVAPVYPPIARAAHVSGTVVMVATFDLSGRVTEVRTVSGPVMLRASAETFVKGWQANAYTGPRSCPVVVGFKFFGSFCSDEDAKKVSSQPSRRTDTQHFLVTGYAYSLCDPAAVISRRKRFGIFSRPAASE